MVKKTFAILFLIDQMQEITQFFGIKPEAG